MKNKSADYILDVLISFTRHKVSHWEYVIDVVKKTEPNDTLGITHIEGICSAHRNTLAMLEREKEWL